MVSLVEKANGRNGNEISEEVVKKIFEREKVSKLDLLHNQNYFAIKQLLQNLSIFAMPVGSGYQIFAIQAIGELGIQHSISKGIYLGLLKELKRSEISETVWDELITKL